MNTKKQNKEVYNQIIETYTIYHHRHNFAIWTAARAVQRNFTSTSKIKYAIEKSGIQEFAESDIEYTQKEFDKHHISWCNKIVNYFKENNIEKCSYGRAAKIISIYLKTSVILCSNGYGNRSQIIHPPIDSILIQKISKLEGLSDLKKIRWTKLDQNNYWILINRLRSHFRIFNWKIEVYWKPELD